LELDGNDRFLVLHHQSAGKYYKMNVVFLGLFLIMSYNNYKRNKHIFVSNTIGKVYIAAISIGLLSLYFFGNRHIRSLYLLPNGKEVAISTYKYLGFYSGKEKIYSIN
jgi:hypothetical protein